MSPISLMENGIFQSQTLNSSFLAYSQFAVNGRQNALHLPHGEHAAEERVAGVVAAVLVAKHVGAVVYAHRQLGVRLLEDVRQLHQVGAPAEV